MSIKPILYQDARKQMKAGDVIAFSGKGDFSEIIILNLISILTILKGLKVESEE